MTFMSRYDNDDHLLF